MGAEKARICRERQKTVYEKGGKRKESIRNLRGLRLMQSDNRGLLEETWTTGSSRESRDCLEKMTASCKGKKERKSKLRHGSTFHACTCVCLCLVPVTLLRKQDCVICYQAETYMHATVLLKLKP